MRFILSMLCVEFNVPEQNPFELKVEEEARQAHNIIAERAIHFKNPFHIGNKIYDRHRR